MHQPEAVIMPDDVLAIRFAGENKTTEASFNSFGMSSQASQGGEYHVNANGNIDIYQIGAVKAAGLTREELRRILLDSITRYLKSPNVTVRFVNFRFTVLGEVRAPGSFAVSRDNVTILEALGQAGDMTQYASRNSVRVIRDSSGKREIGMIDFNQKTVFTSPYYFLQRNDVVYVSPQKSKTEYESVTRITSIIGTVLGILAVTLTILNL
jgi:polysaccharide export outer membrane protein